MKIFIDIVLVAVFDDRACFSLGSGLPGNEEEGDKGGESEKGESDRGERALSVFA